MAEPRARFIQDILEEHLEELEFLWGQRRVALRSPMYTASELVDLEERIVAHAEAMLVADDAVVPLVEPLLEGEEIDAVFAGAFTLLKLGTELSLQRFADAWKKAKGPQLVGIREALLHGSIEKIKRQLDEAYAGGPPPLAATAAEVLAFHSQLPSIKNPPDPRLLALLADDDPDVRAGAWRTVTLLA